MPHAEPKEFTVNCSLRTADENDKRTLLLTLNDGTAIVFRHTRADGPALERQLIRRITSLMAAGNMEMPGKTYLIIHARQDGEANTPDNEIALVWDEEFAYGIYGSFNTSELPEPENIKENFSIDCRHALPTLENNGHVICNCDRDGTNISPARCNTCREYKSKYIEFPITVTGIETGECVAEKSMQEPGAPVAVRLADSDKTYLGIYLGELPMFISSSYRRANGTLSINPCKNPAMFVFELNRIVYGFESFWRKIESESELKEITDNDIKGQFYMRYFADSLKSEGDAK